MDGAFALLSFGEGKVSLLREKLTVDEEFRLSLQDRVLDLALI